MRSDILIPIDPGGPLSLQDQIRQAMVRAITSGDLPAGAKAPSTRGLAVRLGVSRNTVLLAYQGLQAEGYLVSRERSGLFVAPEIPTLRQGPGEVAGARGGSPKTPFRPTFRNGGEPGNAWRTPPDWTRYPYPFVDGLVDPTLFPLKEWRDTNVKAFSGRDLGVWASGRGDADDPTLIDEIRTKVLPRRGIFARPDEILITVGSQQALSLCMEMFVDRRSTVAMEEPGYQDLRRMVTRAGAILVSQPVDACGLVVDDRLHGADVIVVTPSHQYPTGVTLSQGRREALLRLAAAQDAMIIEDDFEGAVDYFEPALPSLRAMPGGERVIYVAALSSVLSPMLRIGFMVADPRVISEARRLRRLAIKQPPFVSQRSAAHFLGQGHYDRMIARTGRVLRDRRLALGEALNHYLQRYVAINPAAGGASFWITGPEEIDVHQLATDAQASGVLIELVNHHFHGNAPANVFRMGVTGIPLDRIRPGVAALAGLIRKRMSPSFDPAARAPISLSGEALRAAMAGTTLLCKTIYGAPCTIELRPDGVMVGRAGYANEDRDEGRWWVDGDLWLRQWRQWAYGEVSGYRPRIEGGRVHWLNTEGIAVDSAVITRSDGVGADGVNLAP